MKRIACLAVLLALLAGCATTKGTASSADAAGTPFRGEVWTWDERTNVVTLRQGTQNIRVRVTPDQIRTLRIHEITTVRGELAPPENIQQVATPSGPMRAVPRGTPQQSEVDGTVGAADPKGLVSIDTTTGRLTVWTATPDTSNFPPGTAVRVKMSVQAVQMVPASDAGRAATPSASIAAEPGDSAIVTGRIMSTDSRGTITVESPRGPITVVIPTAASQSVGDSVQVRTLLKRAQ